MMNRRRFMSHSLLLVTVGCEAMRSSNTNEPRVEFGLYFGGQIQQRIEIPFELDSTRQTQGFRLEFPAPVESPTLIEWTLDCPTARTGPRGPSNAPRAERTERATLPRGADRFEQTLVWKTTDVPGTYNLRVRVEGRVVLDRPFALVAKQPDRD